MSKLVALDGLRGVAALCIAFRHLPLNSGSGPQPPLFKESYLAVDFFFVLSGFVMAYAYQQQFSTGMSAGQFLLRRLIRLYPLYFLSLILAVPLCAVQFFEGKITSFALVNDIAFALVLLPSPTNGALFPTNTQAWSLFFELVANAIFGLLGRRVSSPALAIIVLSTGLMLFIAVSVSWVGFATSEGPMDAGPEWRSIGGGFVRVLFSFFAGVLIHRLWQFRLLHCQSNGVALILNTVLVVALSTCPSSTAAVSYDLFLTLIVFPVLVYIGASCAIKGRLIGIFTWLGGVSYPVYILQGPFYGYASHAVPAMLHQNYLGFSPVVGVCVMIYLILMAKGAELYFDGPIRGLLSDAVAKRRSVQAASPE